MEEAVAVVLANRRAGGRALLEGLLVLDATAAREELDPSDPLMALFDGGDADLTGALGAALAVRNASDEELIEPLAQAHRGCRGLLAEAALRIALSPHALERRSDGDLALVLLPNELRGGTDQWVDLSRSPRRFHLFWALATAGGPVHVEDLFHRGWGRPPVDDDDLLALRTTVSRSRGLFRDLTIATVPEGYVLEPSVALYTHKLAPVGDAPLAPVGREVEAAQLRHQLVQDGVAALTGRLGSGCSHLARHIAAAWPSGAWVDDRRHSRPFHLGDRLLVVDHGEGPLPEERPLLWVGHTKDVEAVQLGPLSTRDGASLAKALERDPPETPTLPLWICVEPAAFDELGPVERRILSQLLGVPRGATLVELGHGLSTPVLALSSTLSHLCDQRLVTQIGDRYVTEHAFTELFETTTPPDEAALPTTRSTSLPTRLDQALVEAHRHLARATSAERTSALLRLVRVSFRAGRPDRGAEAELEASGPMKEADQALWLGHRGQRNLWRGALFEAREQLQEAARRHAWLGSELEAEWWAEDADAALRQGLDVQAARSLRRARRGSEDIGSALVAAMALDGGDATHATEQVAQAGSPAMLCRAAQIAAAVGGPPVDLAPAHEGFEATDRRWSSITWILDALLSGRPELLAQAERRLVPEDAGSHVALALARATFSGDLPQARETLRQPYHLSTNTYTWDIVRSVFSPDAHVMQRQ